MNEKLKTVDLISPEHTLAAGLLKKSEYPWQALPEIGGFILGLIDELRNNEDYELREENVLISKRAKIYPNSFIAGPVIIGAGTEVRPGAFIRGKALVGEGCVIGNSTELKNVIISDGAQVPHYNYVGDSILGFKAHMGAGAVTSNVKQDKSLVAVRLLPDGGRLETGLKKFGAALGDGVEIGCNSVLNPGTVIGKYSRVYPLSRVRGFVPGGMIYKGENAISEII